MVNPPSSYIGPNLQVIIPSFQFTDSGNVSAFQLAGVCSGAEGGAQPNRSVTVSCINILQVWRPSADVFNIAANFTATLRVPFAVATTASVTVDEPIPFSSGDVLGFTPGPVTGLFFQIATLSQQPGSHMYYNYSRFTAEVVSRSNGIVASPIISVKGEHVTHEALTL